MANVLRIALSLGIVVLMMATGFACVDVEAKGRPGGGTGEDNYFRGSVIQANGPNLAGIRIDLYYARGNPTNPDNYQHQITFTNQFGHFELTPSTVSSAITYHLYAGSAQSDGYWTQHHICYLPDISDVFLLQPDNLGYVYPFKAYGNTNHVTEITLVKELTETYTVYSTLARNDVQKDPLAYFDQYHYDFKESYNFGSGYSGSPSLDCRIPFYFSGQKLTDVNRVHLNPAVIEGYFAAKKTGAAPEWGNFLNDWLAGPAFGTQTAWIAPGYAFSDYRDEVSVTSCIFDGASFTHFNGPNGVPQTIWLGMEITHSSPKADSVYWRVVNSGTVSHRYTYWYDGDVIHIWMSA